MGKGSDLAEGFRTRFRTVFLGRDAMVLVLTWAAGGVDAISYLGLGHVFTANMTGNTVLLGLAIGQGQGLAALRSIIALGAFGLGVGIGATIGERSPQRGDWPRAITRAVMAEWVILALFTSTWHLSSTPRQDGSLYALIALSAVAMGIQSAAVRHLKVPGIATTYITGTLTSTVAGFVGWLHTVDVSSSADEGTEKPANRVSSAAVRKHGARLQAAVFVVYLLAAFASGFLQLRRSWLVTLSPFVAVALVVVNASRLHRHE